MRCVGQGHDGAFWMNENRDHFNKIDYKKQTQLNLLCENNSHSVIEYTLAKHEHIQDGIDFERIEYG